MDPLIQRFDAVLRNDLVFCEHRGVAYQANMRHRTTSYGADYLKKVDSYDNTTIGKAVNAGRVEMMKRHLPAGASVLDWGAGSGAMVRDARGAGFAALGYEVMLPAVERLKSAEWWGEDPRAFDALTFWDSLEHIEDPQLILSAIPKGRHCFVSLPIFDKLKSIYRSKHYRPGEHLYYFTEQGFVDWMALWGFRLLETSAHEIDAGREAIGAFAFIRDLPDYHDHIAAYQQIHATRFYGSSATELHLGAITGIVKRHKPTSIIDYGCGRSDLLAHFYLDGARKLARYDPAIPTFKSMPEGCFDLALCCDVMEHVPMASVDRVLREVRRFSGAAVFTISTKPSRAKLPDGRNAHVTLLRESEWTAWLQYYWGSVVAEPTQWEHELMLLAGGFRGR